jgi:hypothetical protein
MYLTASLYILCRCDLVSFLKDDLGVKGYLPRGLYFRYSILAFSVNDLTLLIKFSDMKFAPGRGWTNAFLDPSGVKWEPSVTCQ